MNIWSIQLLSIIDIYPNIIYITTKAAPKPAPKPKPKRKLHQGLKPIPFEECLLRQPVHFQNVQIIRNDISFTTRISATSCQ